MVSTLGLVGLVEDGFVELNGLREACLRTSSAS